MVRQVFLYIAIIAFLIFILLVSGGALYFTLSASGVVRPTISVITITPSGKDKTKSAAVNLPVSTAENQKGTLAPQVKITPKINQPAETTTDSTKINADLKIIFK